MIAVRIQGVICLSTNGDFNLKRGFAVTMTELARFVRLLAEQMYTARLSTGQTIRDASDFHAWLMEVGEIAEQSDSLRELLDALSPACE
jgi:hypothetical protein